MTTILLIDDDDSYRILMSLALTDRGFRVISAETAEDGLYELSRHVVDAVVTDIRLPGLDGNSLVSEIRLRDTVPIVAVSGADDRGGEAALSAGANLFLAKPTAADELDACLRSLIAEANSLAPNTIRAGRLTLRHLPRCVELDGREIDLSPAEFDLLEVLITPPLQVRSRGLLSERLFGPRPVNAPEIDRCIDRVRLALDADSSEPPHIVAVGEAGYRYDP
jgi:DNA-binding response OmpR family regulator